jgi:Predicted site-specific integrase-resolvase
MPTYEDFDLEDVLPAPVMKFDAKNVEGNRLFLTPGEVADRFGVSPKTVARWALSGKLDGIIRIIRTPGNHRRFLAEDVNKLTGSANA